MTWQQLIIQATPDNSGQISSILESFNAAAVTMSDGKDQPIFEPERGTTPLWDSVHITALFDVDTDINKVIAIISEQLGTTPVYKHDLLAEKDWVRAWMDDFKPMQFGKRVWIIPSHHVAPEPDAINIELDPGLAFGTGTHPTTAMCLAWLDKNIPHDNRDKLSVLDYGCGSGILALAAAKLGATTIYAVDNDPQAIDATLMNAKQNHVDNIQALLSDHVSNKWPDLQVDILLANILAAPLIALAPLFQRYCHKNTRIVLAGLLSNQVNDICQAYANWCTLTIADQIDDWICLENTL